MLHISRTDTKKRLLIWAILNSMLYCSIFKATTGWLFWGFIGFVLFLNWNSFASQGTSTGSPNFIRKIYLDEIHRVSL